MPDAIRSISRDRLMKVFKDADLVRLFESVLYGVGETLPNGLTELDGSKQATSPLLTAIAALDTEADKIVYFMGENDPVLCDLTPFARALLAKVDAAEARTALGLGTMSTQDADAVAITGGAITGGQILLSSGILGYWTGNGGTEVQVGSKSAAVTLNKICGQITMDAAALAAGATVSFTLNNSTVGSTDYIGINHIAGGTIGAYTFNGRCTSGAAVIYVTNRSGGSLPEALVLRYDIFKMVIA